MALTSRIETVDTHTEGEPTRIILRGVEPLAGRNMRERLACFRERHDSIRTMLLAEPRGHRDMYGAMLTEPTVAEAQFGVFYLDNGGYMEMCGHATIGVSTALVELGLVPRREPVTTVVLDTPAGLVRAAVKVEGERAVEVTFRNVPGYASHVNVPLDVPGVGTLPVDVAYGGNHFVYFQAGDAGLELGVSDIEQVIGVAVQVREAASQQLPIRDPLSGAARTVNIATVLGPPTRPDATYRNVHVFGPRQFDRSPGGTGTTARLAALYARKEIAPGGTIAIESLTGGLFRGRLVETVPLGDQVGVITEVTGSAHVTGFHQFVVSEGDRLAKGFLIR